jgi:5-formaminoimidazole-4-carboxamide-1-beta-D-ribofuranosyl 5'-monophosphate synthetase
MFIPYYDEFLIYTTKDDILEFIESLVEKGLKSQEDITNITIENFGKDLKDQIEYIVYEFTIEDKELQSI